ncbi:glycosyl hydrolase family 28-related protein [Shouchella clausii]|uniref:glycosyl hydrolase family 28-related protein n=1 Tax=Shouchella clausii TaxID=79880 RepID=UPI002E237C23|nr:glycosyl hydrolase family 28-related protein [Shouchella clausii]MED4176997.1 glycosyl hydrolase family 28-related protein [Shouchella clausii]
MKNLPLPINSEVYQRLNDIKDLRHDAGEAVRRSKEAERTANNADHRSDITNKRLTEAIKDGDQLAETQAARVNGVTGEVSDTLPDRLDDDYRYVTNGLNQIYKDIGDKALFDTVNWSADNLTGVSISLLFWLQRRMVDISLPPYNARIGDRLSEEEDQSDIINQALRDLRDQGGGAVYIPKGVLWVSKPVIMYSDTAIFGNGPTNSFIKARSDANIPSEQGLVQTADFQKDRGVWDYYEPYPVGLHMGIGIANICIDGNKANVLASTGNGICVYGGRWTFHSLSVINTVEHGIWTECGRPDRGSMAGDDFDHYLNMHESTAEQIMISGAGKHGWLYRGPNDTYINNIQIKACGWSAFVQDSGSKIFTAGLKLGNIHYYVCNQRNDNPIPWDFYSLASVRWEMMYCDTPIKHGIYLGGNASQPGLCKQIKRNRYTDHESIGLMVDALAVQGGSFYISNEMERDNGKDGINVWITDKASRCQLDVSIYGADSSNTRSEGIRIDGSNNQINLILDNFRNNPLSRGLIIKGNNNKVEGIIRRCASAVIFDDASGPISGNMLDLVLTGNLRDITQQNVYSNNVLQYYSDRVDAHVIDSKTFIKQGNLKNKNWASTISIDANHDDNINVILQGATTIGNPTNPRVGARLKVRLYVGENGGFPVYWGHTFRTTWTNPTDLTQIKSKRAHIEFEYIGDYWEQISYQSWY